MKPPRLNLDHFIRLTDQTGILQFGKPGVGDPSSGYAIDDNARALIVAARMPPSPTREELAAVYLRFLQRAQRPDGAFAHEVGYDRSLSAAPASDDGLGRTLWACGEVIASDLPEAMKHTAAALLDGARSHVAGIRHVRGWANAAQGLALCAHGTADGRAHDAVVECAEQLLVHLTSYSDSAWVWFEDILTYEPGRLPLGLLFAAALTGELRYFEAAERVLAYLERTLYRTTPSGRFFVPVGNGGWYPRGGERAEYDQQPVDAGSLVEACAAAAALTGEVRYRSLAEDAFGWFLGANTIGAPVYNATTGACHDGLYPLGVSLNAGAESTISYLLARLTLSSRGTPINRLPGAHRRILSLRGARLDETAPEPPVPSGPPVRPTGAPLRSRPMPRR